jgi:hypothetical protein
MRLQREMPAITRRRYRKRQHELVELLLPVQLPGTDRGGKIRPSWHHQDLYWFRVDGTAPEVQCRMSMYGRCCKGSVVDDTL